MIVYAYNKKEFSTSNIIRMKIIKYFILNKRKKK